MFATIKNLIPEPRQADQPRRYTGRHRRPEPLTDASTTAAPVSPASLAVAVVPEPDETTETAAA